MNMRTMKSKKGISLINLIIIVAVVIIIAIIVAIVRNSSSEEKFAKFQKDYKEFSAKIQQDFANRKTEILVDMDNKNLYYAIAIGVKLSDVSSTNPISTVEELGIDLKPTQLLGNEVYEITKDANILNINKEYQFYQSDEKHYLTDGGELFVLPGYLVKDDGNKWYVTDTKYYESELPITNLDEIEITNIKITSDEEGKNEAKTNLKKDEKAYITFDATLNGVKANITPSIPFEVSKNDTYKFVAKVNGRAKNISIPVYNFRTQNPSDILKIGDYIDYTPDSTSIQLSKDNNGYASQTFATEKKEWKILYIDKETENIFITPIDLVNNGVALSGTIGYAKGTEVLNNICKQLYSNAKLNLNARCISVEDVNKMYDMEISKEKMRYAYYPRGTSVNGTIEFNDNTYTKTTNDWRTSRFYASDGGGTENTDSNGLKYREPDESNPVFVTQSFYSYKLNSNYATISNVLGKSGCWLASKSVYASKSGAAFGIRTYSSSGVDAEILYDSYANVYTKTMGLHPIVEIDSLKYTIDTNDQKRNGSTPEKAWKIVKDIQ